MIIKVCSRIINISLPLVLTPKLLLIHHGITGFPHENDKILQYGYIQRSKFKVSGCFYVVTMLIFTNKCKMVHTGESLGRKHSNLKYEKVTSLMYSIQGSWYLKILHQVVCLHLWYT